LNKKLIGKGTFGKVYKVTDAKGTIGALKVIDKQYHKFRIQFKSAFEITKKINDINYVKALQWLSDKDVSWVMEYVDGKPISSLKFTDSNSLDKILKVMIQVCNGLVAFHSRNIIHRDLKPQNILYDKDNIVKITDFDFVKIQQTGTQITQFIGTPVYASPEHFISSYELDIRSDLYSVGVIFYELVTGKLPITGKDAKEIGDKHRLKPIVLPSKINPNVPVGVEKIITGLLEKNPKDRYQHAHAVAVDLFKEIKNKKDAKLKEDVSYLLKPRFVNREIHLQTLNKLSDDLENKNGKVVLVLGESGIGKSKLIQQFYHYLQLQNVDFHYSVCKQVEHSFEPLSSLFEEMLSSVKTEAKKLKYFGNFGWDLVAFGILTEKKWMNKIDKPAELSGKVAEIRLFSAITHFIQKAAVKSLVICIDDLQWADEIIMKWLNYAERNLKKFPIIIIGLHRSEQLMEDSLILKIENLIQIRIKNLKGVDVSFMIRSMLGKKSTGKELRSFIKNIVSHTKGNPLFIREILYYLQDKGKITIENNKWKFPLDPEMKELPTDIHKIILDRIHELSKETLITLQAASVIGKKFSYEMLLNMTKKNDIELLDDLIDCREVSLIEESGNNYFFIHDKVREVVENETKEKHPSFWKKLHLKAGEFLEEKYSSIPDEVLDDLADHFYKADDKEKSIKYLEMAGIRAKREYHNEKAVEYFEKLMIILGVRFEKMRKNDTQYDQIQQSLYDACYNRGTILFQIGKMDDAIKDLLAAKKIMEQINDNQMLFELFHSIGWCYLYVEEYGDREDSKALYYFQEALKIAEKLDSKITLSKIFNSLSIEYRKLGNYEKHTEYYKKCLEIIPDWDDDHYLHTVYLNIGLGHQEQGNYEKALEYFHKSLNIAGKYKNYLKDKFPKAGYVLYINFGLIHKNLGNFNEAIMYYKKGLKITDEIGDKLGFSTLIFSIAIIYCYKKEYKTALEYIGRAVKIQEECDFRAELFYSLTLKLDFLFYWKKYSELKRTYEMLVKYMPKKSSYAIDEVKVYQARISFHTAKEEKLKNEKGIKPIEKILKKEKDEWWIAQLNYRLWKFKEELASNLHPDSIEYERYTNEAEKNRKIALELYRKLSKKYRLIFYKNRFEELEKLN